MASRIRLKWGGAGWYGPIGDGNLRLKWGGSSWFIPSLVYVKTSDGAANGTAAVTNGGYGANPRWVDSGYRGAPGTPSTPAVYSWPSYTYMTIYCHGSTVGAPAVSFDALADGLRRELARRRVGECRHHCRVQYRSRRLLHLRRPCHFSDRSGEWVVRTTQGEDGPRRVTHLRLHHANRTLGVDGLRAMGQGPTGVDGGACSCDHPELRLQPLRTCG